MRRRERALALPLVTSEVRLCELRIAGHPVELFSEEPKRMQSSHLSLLALPTVEKNNNRG